MTEPPTAASSAPPPGTPDHGTGRHWAVKGATGLAVALVVLVLVVIVIAVFLDGDEDADRDSGGDIAQEQDVSVFEVNEGDCLDDETLAAIGGGETSEVEEVRAIPCDEAHTLEVFHVFDLEGDDDYPGLEEVEALSEEECSEAFASFIGVPPLESELAYYYLYPQEETWTELDDRQVVCLVGQGDQSSMTGSLEGSRR